ncbi:hypothetical protein [Streptomyces griseiscabiei]|uniref:Uncharacterized protein n=1 Tax=Streptomyces griseiscabiei TaxID=2993540 RepID=A0ABU4LHH6_9ACTN|nr:hypothetical protein [Streptomyces griseiscabiei]MBZ3900088.1 hypothetical protein [Streptomyces griseiscabiei]MDX2914634.1 hypothetical protein [Streptomyces griseiscabiei]
MPTLRVVERVRGVELDGDRFTGGYVDAVRTVVVGVGAVDEREVGAVDADLDHGDRLVPADASHVPVQASLLSATAGVDEHKSDCDADF